jgi:hypothetical protein
VNCGRGWAARASDAPQERIGADPAGVAAALESAGFSSAREGGGNPGEAALGRIAAQTVADFLNR